jgi:NifU-like protein
MGLSHVITPFPWTLYSKKLMNKIDNPRYAGFFVEESAKDRGVRLVIGEEGSIVDGNMVRLYWLVDLDDGIIVDLKFQVFGQSALIGAGEAACELLIGKNYDQARRMSADLIDKNLRDRSEDSAFPRETIPHLNLVISAIDNAALQCTDIALSTTYIAPPTPVDLGEIREGGYPDWDKLDATKQMAIIEEVLNNDIRPYVELDAGGVDVLSLTAGREIIIAYKGSCTSCFSATGATLSAIQRALRAKIHPDIVVIPDMGVK